MEQRVQQIMEMGGGSWDEETVLRALRAAYYNPERAVDYLYSVCPHFSVKVFFECFQGNETSENLVLFSGNS